MPPSLQIALNLSKGPEFLTRMGSLTRLLLSNNHLSGALPLFKPFVVVDFSGNKDLVNSTANETSPNRTNSVIVVILRAVICVVLGVSIAITIVLVVNNTSRRKKENFSQYGYSSSTYKCCSRCCNCNYDRITCYIKVLWVR
ncbi:hypothetical protein MKW94_013386 [Papaver nudicaule]|uniref:Uncharacterized protein n=1 Tax=Papaver nudicaule TaxID=74823 RepID=A0AA41V082_PAPNU|nr:hypothetical protein [Papaver nudicaule]